MLGGADSPKNNFADAAKWFENRPARSAQKTPRAKAATKRPSPEEKERPTSKTFL